jgi:hypothetical protein
MQSGLRRFLLVVALSFVLGLCSFAAERFVDNKNGTVTDTKTGLMWAAKDNGSKINWYDAKKYCESYRGGGYSDWRLPTISELSGLYDAEQWQTGRQQWRTDPCDPQYPLRLITNLIQLTCDPIWSSDTTDSSSEALFFVFVNGSSVDTHRSSSGNIRALPVRTVKK